MKKNILKQLDGSVFAANNISSAIFQDITINEQTIDQYLGILTIQSFFICY